MSGREKKSGGGRCEEMRGDGSDMGADMERSWREVSGDVVNQRVGLLYVLKSAGFQFFISES